MPIPKIFWITGRNQRNAVLSQWHREGKEKQGRGFGPGLVIKTLAQPVHFILQARTSHPFCTLSHGVRPRFWVSRCRLWVFFTAYVVHIIKSAIHLYSNNHKISYILFLHPRYNFSIFQMYYHKTLLDSTYYKLHHDLF